MLAAEVNDVPDAVTRFVVVVSRARCPPPPARTGPRWWRFLREDHPGALMELLTEFAVRGINLTRIESRPTGDGLGKYCFSIDCEGHLDDARVGEALMGLRRVCADVRFLGSYPRRDGGRTQVRAGTSDAEFAQAAAWLGRLRYGARLARPQTGSPARRRWPGPRAVTGTGLRTGPVALLPRLRRAGHHAGRQRAAHLLELGPRGHLLREQRGLDAVEQPLQPADQLGLRDPQLGLAGVSPSVNGRESRSSSSTSSGARPSSSSLMELRWISASLARLFSSSGAAFTSSSSWRIMLPILITLAGCSTISITGRSP